MQNFTFLSIIVLVFGFYSCDDSNEFILPDISKWAGTYDTELTLRGSSFSPLIIDGSGTLKINGVQISYEYDPTYEIVTFTEGPYLINREKLQLGEITFKKDRRIKYFEGEVVIHSAYSKLPYMGEAR